MGGNDCGDIPHQLLDYLPSGSLFFNQYSNPYSRHSAGYERVSLLVLDASYLVSVILSSGKGIRCRCRCRCKVSIDVPAKAYRRHFC